MKMEKDSSISMISFGRTMPTSLQDQLDEITANTRHLVQSERLAVGERAVEELFASGIESRILPVGATAPEFELNDATGRLVRSADMLALGPLIIKFFRGRWCSYCVTELEAWRDLYGTIREREALMVAIGPQTQRQSDFMAGQHGLPFPVLCDPANKLAEQFGLVYTIPEYHRSYYQSILVNIPFVNGEPSWRLPIPATYVIVQRPQGPLRRSPRRLPRPPRTRRSLSRRLLPPQPLTI